MKDAQMKAIATQISKMTPTEVNALAHYLIDQADKEMVFTFQVLAVLTKP